MTRSLMVWGTSSGAGKSLLATALCRWAAQRGVDVAQVETPIKGEGVNFLPSEFWKIPFLGIFTENFKIKQNCHTSVD